MALEFYTQKAVNPSLQAKGLSTAITLHRARMREMEVISAVAAQAGMSTGTCQAIFQGYAELLAREISNGSVVEMPYLGTIRADVRGTFESGLSSTRGETTWQPSIRINPQFRASADKYVTIQQVPKVMPSPDIQFVDTSFKFDRIPGQGQVWGPANMPTDQVILIPEHSMITIQGKHLIWDDEAADEGIFFIPTDSAQSSSAIKIPATQMIRSRGRQVIISSPAAMAPNPLTYFVEIRSRLGTKDLRNNPFRPMIQIVGS